jgi:hypothetical protein
MKQKEKKESRVFVLQKQNRYDISSVKDYSKNIIYLAEDERINQFDTFGFIDLIVYKLRKFEFNPDIDFICLTGSSVLLSLFLATITRRYNMHDNFKLLMFNSKTNKYQLRIANFEV